MIGETLDAGHLGGYIVGGDPATWFPELWDWLVEDRGIRSMLDIGCGEGHSTRYFAARGVDSVGVDGIEQPGMVRHDFTLRPWDPGREFDLIWCCEFLEHLEERFLPNLVPAFRRGRAVVLTHAFPGQDGHHHVNCRTEDYWRGYFAALGFAVNDGLTGHARGLAARNLTPENHFVRSGLVLERS